MSWEDIAPGLVAIDNWSPGPFNGHVGLELVRWGPGGAEGALDLKPHHANSLGVTHGGVSMTALDFVMGMSGCYGAEPALRRRCMTMAMTTNFVAPVLPGRLTIRGWVTGGGRSTFFPAGEILDETGKLLVTATGVFRYLRDAAP